MRAETLWPPKLHPPFPFKLPLTKPFDPAMILDMRLYEGVGSLSRDLSQFKNDGTIYGAAWTGLGRHGHALDFDGVDDYVDLHDIGVAESWPCSVAAWVLTTASGHFGIIYADGNTTSTTPIFSYYNHPDTDHAAYHIRNDAGVEYSGEGTTIITDGTWHFIALTVDGTTARLYVDGVQEDSTPVPDQPITMDFSSIGMRNYGGTLQNYWDGIIDEVRIYRRALSADEIKRMYELLR